MPSHRARRRGPPRFILVLAVGALAIGVVLAGRTLLTADAPLADSGSPRPQHASTTSATAAPSASRSRSPEPHSLSTHRPNPRSSPSPPGSPSPHDSSNNAHRGSVDARAEAAVLAQINRARARAGLPAYTRTSGLQRSAGRHNARMVAGCGLSHQCPGEAAIGERESAAGVRWTAAGENIGEGGPVAVTSITAMAETLTRDMLNEKPPDDGHRLNLLSKTFTHIGIVIYRDSHGVVWMTQDFSN